MADIRSKIIRITIISVIFFMLAGIVFFTARNDEAENQTLVIAMPWGEFIRNMDTNYYKLWLEEKTGLSLSFVYLEDIYTADYLESAFSNGDVHIDAFFSFKAGYDYLSTLALLQDFGRKDYILPINEYLDGSTNLERIFTELDSYDLQALMTSPDGRIYFMPGLDVSRGKSTESILWLNKSWLSKLKLAVPQTTEQLHVVLEAFKTEDPNRNNLADEIPLCGTLEADGQQLYNSIINSFIYCDPNNSYLMVDEGEIIFAPTTNEWQSAMKYLSRLYADGLISPLLTSLSERGLSELANNPSGILGGFTADHITDVLLQNSPETLSSFIHVAPLEGPDGQQNATASITMPNIAGVITASCKNPQAVFNLFDLMLSEEAFLIGRYGEEGADWETAHITDMDFYDRKGTVRIINQLANKMQNKHISELGPFYAYPMYADGVSFTGLESDQEYINARAVRAYEPFMPVHQLGTALYITKETYALQELRNNIDAYTQECILGFITGSLDPYDEVTWQNIRREYDAMGITQLVSEAQVSYDVMMGMGD